jgi:two-component system, sensor histidine kinase PdtaS
VSTLSELIAKHGEPNKANIEWLTLLLSEWQLVADLLFADLVLWVPSKQGDFIAVGHARPSSAATIFFRDITGETIKKEWLALAKQAFESGEIAILKTSDSTAGLPTKLSAIPVRRGSNSNEVAAPIALITRHTNIADSRTPNKLHINYVNCGNELLGMVSEGSFPDFSTPTGPRRGAPRANDGLLRLDVDGIVSFRKSQWTLRF